MISAEHFERLRERLEEFVRERDRALGRLDELKDRLFKEHGCKTPKEAKDKIAKIDGELVKLEAEYRELERQIKETLDEHAGQGS